MSLPLRLASLLLVALFLSASGTTYGAAASRKAPAPKIEAFSADPADEFSPGTEITFSVEGTPKAKASVKISGIPKTIVLDEVDSGVYEGSYTVRSRDKIGGESTARASLRSGNRTASATLAFKAPAAPVAAAPAAPAPTPAPAASAPKIDRFATRPVEKIDPGADLRFALNGTPGGKASFVIEGVTKEPVAMREVKPGYYEGTYTIRRLDNFPANVNIYGQLEAAGQTTRTRLAQPLIVDARPPVLKNLAPREGEAIGPGPLTIGATFDDSGGLGVDPKSVSIAVDGKDVTPSATITPQSFSYRVVPSPGTHQVQVNARDNAGNAMRHVWSFTVSAQPAVLPLQILSHANNALIPAGRTEIRGRTAPGAAVDVHVQQVAAVAGLFGVNQEVVKQTVQADANGNFAFGFQPPFSVPGARFEIAMKARSPQGSREMQLVLFQQR